MLSVFPAICHLYFPLLQNKTHLMTHLKDTVFVIIYIHSQRLRHYSVNGIGRQCSRYPDTIVDDAFLGILVIFFLRVNTNPVGCQVLPYLSKGQRVRTNQKRLRAGAQELNRNVELAHWAWFIAGMMNVKNFTLSLNSCLSSMVSASALAMTGTMLTILPSLFINSMSMERNLKKQNKTKHHYLQTYLYTVHIHGTSFHSL